MLCHSIFIPFHFFYKCNLKNDAAEVEVEEEEEILKSNSK
jgi:hypothetical protein